MDDESYADGFESAVESGVDVDGSAGARSLDGGYPQPASDGSRRSARADRRSARGRSRRDSDASGAAPRRGRAVGRPPKRPRREDPAEPGARPARRRNCLVGCLAALLVLALALGAGAYAVWNAVFRPAVDVEAGMPVQVTVKPGTGSGPIAELLAGKGIVANALMFRWRAREMGLDGELKSGTYAFTTGMEYEPVIAKLAKGPDIVFYDVVIPEGATIEQAAKRFADGAGIPEAEFLALARTGASRFATEHPYLKGAYKGSLQGYLFPKTYRIRKGTKPEAVIEMMLDQFDTEVAGVDLSYAKGKGYDLAEVLTIASIIEKEARIASEYPKVSAVIYNRLRIGMALQMCSTVMYGLPVKPDRLTNAHLKNRHPFNTYLRTGLPPGPMGSPGMRAIEAAAHPVDKKYLYFVLTGKDGSQTFASDYAGFLKAKQKNKQVFGD